MPSTITDDAAGTIRARSWKEAAESDAERSSYIFAKVLGWRRAMDVLLTNRTLDAKTAYEWQLVNEVYRTTSSRRSGGSSRA